jgi:long-subunit fatty acid transport protein
MKYILSSLLVLWILLPDGLIAQTAEDAARILDNELGFGARALGMGGAYTGVADDYSAVYWNPSGLALMRKMEIYLDFSHVRFSNDEIYQGNTANSISSNTKFNAIGFAFPVPTARGSLVFGLGYQKVKDFDYFNEFKGLSDSDNGLSFIVDTTEQAHDFFGKDLTRGELITDEGSMDQFNLSGAIDISPNVSFGLGLNYWNGKSDYNLSFIQTDTEDNFQNFPADFYEYKENRIINSEYSGFNVVLAAMYRLKRLARIGISYSSAIRFNVNEKYANPATLEFDDGYLEEFDPNEGQYEYDVSVPFELNVGVSVDLGLALLAGSVSYRDWSQLKFKSPSELLDENTFIMSNYKETLRWNIGAETGIPFTSIKVRAGYMRIPNPLKDADPKTDREYYTLGGGFLIDRYIKIDLAAVFGNWEQMSSDDLAPEITAEDIKYQKFLLTFSYRF